MAMKRAVSLVLVASMSRPSGVANALMRAIPTSYITRLVCALTALAIATGGCTSMHRVSPVAVAPTPVSSRVSPGDTIRVTLRDGRRVQFTVDKVEATAIIARNDTGTRYDLTDILTVERREFSGVKTGFLVGGIVGGVWFLKAVAEAAALGAILGGG